MRKLILNLFVASMCAFSQGLVSVTGTITRADGSLANGTANASWQSFTTAGGTVVPAGSLGLAIVSGNLQLQAGGTIQLYPNVGANPPGTSYQITYNLSGSPPFIRQWYIPATTSVNVVAVEFPPSGLVGATAIVSPAQLTQAGAQVGNCLLWNGAMWAAATTCGGGGGGISAVNGTANQISAVTSSGTVTLSLPASILIPGTLTAGSGKIITFSGTGTINANIINGVTLSSLGTGIIKNTTGTGVFSLAASSDVIATFIGPCSSSNFLRGDGACSTPAGAGTVTSFSVASVPSWLTASVATATTTPSLTLVETTGQTSHKVIGTCGSGTTFVPCSLVAADLPTITGSQFANFSAHNFLGNNTGSTATSAPSLIGTLDVTPNWYAADSGAANAYVIAPTPAAALTIGATVRFTTTHANTTTSTINVSSLGVKNLTKLGATALVSGDIVSGGMYEAIYDGTQWQLQNPSTSGSGGGATMASQLGDLLPTITTPNTVLTIGANCSASTPCNVVLRDASGGAQVIHFTTIATATISAGSPTAYIYVDSAGVLSVGVASGTVVCNANCTQTAVSAFPAGSVAIFTWTAASGAWVVGGGTDFRGFLTSNPSSAAGTCMTLSVNTLSFDPTCSTTLTGSNVTMPVVNAGTTGTTVKQLAFINSSGNAVNATTGTTTLPVYIVSSGAGTTGSAQLAIAGKFLCTTDAAGATAGHFIVASTATAGRCMDAGATTPTSGWVIGQALTAASANADTVALAQGFNASSGGSTPGVLTAFNRTQWNDFDEFLPQNNSGAFWGKFNWNCPASIGSGSCSMGSFSYTGHPGVLTVFTSGSSGDSTVLSLNNDNAGPLTWLSLGTTAGYATWEFQFTMLTDDNAGTVTNTGLLFGFADSNGYRTGNQINLRYDSSSVTCGSGSNSTTNWVLEVITSGTAACVDTTVAVAGASWYTFDIKSTTLGTVVASVSSNGGAFSSPVTLSSGVPTAQVFPRFLVKTEAAIAHRFNIDRWEGQLTGITR